MFMSKIKNCIPVIIPTLNRVEHLKRCIGSLQKCVLADKTEIYISVDYPPSEKYVDGWMKIKQFLQNGVDGFKRVNVFYQEDNLGAHDNFVYLTNKVSTKYDVWISSEDDNEFSPNYLTYINQAVEYMKSDDSIYSVCGHLSFSDQKVLDAISADGYNCFRIQTLDAWGHAYLAERRERFREEICFDYLKNILLDKTKRNKLKKQSRDLYRYCVFGMLGKIDSMLSKDKSEIVTMDITAGIYMIMNDMYQIQPVISKVRNWGNDGSGIHCGIDASIQKQTIDDKNEFELKLAPIEIYKEEIEKSILGRVKRWNSQYQIACFLNIVFCLCGKKMAGLCYDLIFAPYDFFRRVRSGKAGNKM